MSYGAYFWSGECNHGHDMSVCICIYIYTYMEGANNIHHVSYRDPGPLCNGESGMQVRKIKIPSRGKGGRRALSRGSNTLPFWVAD